MSQLPPAILLDLDDTILSAFGQAEGQWQRVIASFIEHLAPHPPNEVIAAIQAYSKYLWADQARHKHWRHRIGEARRHIVQSAFAELCGKSGRPVPPAEICDSLADRFNELHEAEGRLRIIIPLTMLLITFLTYSAVKTWIDTLLVIVSIPVACTGGVLALLISGQNFSVSAAMGFISIFGIAIQDAILVVTYFQRQRYSEGKTTREAAREAAEKRFRPVLMTTLVATLGLMPAALVNSLVLAIRIVDDESTTS